MTTLIESLLADLARDSEMSAERRELLRELLARVVAVADADTHTDDLRVAVTAIDELLESFALFDHWRERPKLTIFGSARTPVDSPLYDMTVELARSMTERNWITVTGAGPGIMEASAKGAGKANTLGVNIQLPFEQSANSFIDASTMLVTMKYFFTRKVALTRASNAFVVLPGGLGTMDELFEVLTLLDTGKTTPAPIVLLDTPDGQFWNTWMTFIDEGIIKNHYVDTDDMFLVRMASSVDEAVDEIEHFYSNYENFHLEGERALVSLRHDVTDTQLVGLKDHVPVFNTGLGFQRDDARTVSFEFDRRNYVSLRLIIDEVNSWLD